MTAPAFDLGLAGQRAVVTGAGRGIGLAVTEGLLAAGARVVAGTRNRSEALDDLVKQGAARGPHGGHDVDRERPLPVRVRRGQEAVDPGLDRADVVHQDVQPAEHLGGGRDEAAAIDHRSEPEAMTV